MLKETWFAAVLLLVRFVSELHAGWIDPDTKHHAESVNSYVDGRKHKLVFSDEFNTAGRYFHDGSDPRWTSLNKDDYTNFALHYYNADLVKTSNGYLNISTVVQDIEFVFEDVVGEAVTRKKATKNYQSGMLQGWNKFCFTGGIVEISARLPGSAYTGGLWPAMWMMGNLARATYVGSSNNIWPWSYDTCSRGALQHEQLFSACNAATHYGMHPRQGRGAPEVDILEAMPGKEQLVGTSTAKPYFSASLQVAPAMQGYRPNPGETPVPGLWYPEEHLSYGENSSVNIFFYGMHLDGVTPDRSYSADALSANRNVEPTHFDELHTYRVEWVKGDEGYLQWHLDGELVYRIGAGALNATGAIIPEEPMYLILNTAVSSTWGFPTPCPEGCACDCFDCRDLACACAIPHGMCDNLPAHFLIDYIRVYQAEGDDNQTVGCSTTTHPTAKFIQARADLYKTKHDKVPLKAIKHGGGHCSADADCGGAVVKSGVTQSRGECSSGKCRCLAEDYTGPYCLADNGYDDVIWNSDPTLIVSPLALPRSLVYFVGAAVLLLTVVGVWRYKQERALRSPAGHEYTQIR